MSDKPIVRFAPSPTGKVHICNIRAAIYNWLYARHVGGKFLLRVEDTDLERSTPEAIAVLFDCMKWLGLDWDEEVFYQTKNVKRHLEVVDQLIASGVERSRSVSSTRSRNFPPVWRANSQLYIAARMLPMCTFPVGDGAKRTLVSDIMSDIIPSFRRGRRRPCPEKRATSGQLEGTLI